MMKKLKTTVLLLFTILGFLYYPQLNEEEIPGLRVKIMRTVDGFLSWCMPLRYRTHTIQEPQEEKPFQINSPSLFYFAQKHGHFSKHSLVGTVTKNEQDIILTGDLLRTLNEEIEDPDALLFATGEVLVKVLAYRELEKGREIPLSTFDREGKVRLVTYEVDEVFDLWHGMPAFGLLPKTKGEAAPILLFRGTDFALNSIKSWSSLVSDLDRHGVGVTVFQSARPLLHQWLEKAASFGSKARVFGYSLGATFTLYTLLYEQDLLNEERENPSLAFNPVGLPKNILKRQKKLSKSSVGFISYVTQGDYVRAFGELFGDVYAFSPTPSLWPIAAHVTLVSANPRVVLYKVED